MNNTDYFKDLEKVKNPYGAVDASLKMQAESFTPELVSVIMPCFNSARFLKKAIESVLNQSYAKVELIVVDDGSTDDSQNILASYGSAINVILQKNQGACVARNAGLHIAKGEYIQFLDSDDLLYSDGVEVRVREMDIETDVVFGDYDKINDTDEIFGNVGFPNQGNWERRDTFEYLLKHPARMLISNPLHRRQHIYNSGGYDEALPRYQEANLHLRLVSEGVRWKYVDEIVGAVRFHDSPHRISNNGAWWCKDPLFILNITRNYYTEVNTSAPELVDVWFRETLASILRRNSVTLAAFVSLSWGIRYLREARWVLQESRSKFYCRCLRLLVESRVFWVKFYGGKVKRYLKALMSMD